MNLDQAENREQARREVRHLGYMVLGAVALALLAVGGLARHLRGRS